MTQLTELTKECLENCPCGVLLMDGDGKIIRANAALESMLDLSSAQLSGHDQKSLPFPAYRGLFKGQGLLHLMGPGVKKERWLQCTPGTTSDVVVTFFQDVTEQVRLSQQNEQLQRQVEELTVSDPLTGLANQRAFNRALTAQVTRSRRYQNPLSVLLVELQDPQQVNGQPTDEGILTTSRYLRDRLRWVDVIARWDHNHFLVILPETDAQAAAELIHKIGSEFTRSEMVAEQPGLQLRFGHSSWQKGDDEKKLMDRAAAVLNSEPQDQPAAATS